MATKKKYLFGLSALLVLLFIMLFATFSTCYAETYEEWEYNYRGYVDYAVSTLAQTYNGNYQSNIRGALSTISGDSALKSSLTSYVTTYLSNNNLNLPIINCLVSVLPVSSELFRVYFSWSNCSYPGSYDLGYQKFASNRIYNQSNSSTARIYYIYITILNNGTLYRTSSSSLTPNNGIEATLSDAVFTETSSGSNLFKMTSGNLVACGIQSSYGYAPITQASTIVSCIPYNILGNYIYSSPGPEPIPSGDNSSTGTITNPSGEITGNIDLSGIENGISQVNENLNNIENKTPTSGEIQGIISGEVGKINETLTSPADINSTIISSGDITSSLGFTIAEDPYDNFWVTLTNNLKNALLGSKRSIDISFRGTTWTISLDEYLVLPTWLVIILTPFSTCLIIWVLVREWKLIFDKISSGNVDALLKENSEEGISNLF